LAEEKAARQTAEHALQSSNDVKADFSLELESTQASLTTTYDKLTSKSSDLDTAVIREQKMKIQLTATEEKLKVAKEKLKDAGEKLKNQGQLLDSAQQALSKGEFSCSVVISLAVANAMALVKNHIPDLDMEILCKDFTVDDTGQQALANSAYDAAHDFVSLYDFSSLA
jgi:succinate dehydrogenase/fumarate reductase flavoprotein subunit